MSGELSACLQDTNDASQPEVSTTVALRIERAHHIGSFYRRGRRGLLITSDSDGRKCIAEGGGMQLGWILKSTRFENDTPQDREELDQVAVSA